MVNCTPSVSFFSLSYTQSQLPCSARVAHYEPRKRRKQNRSGDDDDEDFHNDVDEEEEMSDSSALSEEVDGPDLVLSPDEAHQYRVAGLPFNREVPSGNFPHTPTSKRARKPIREGHILKHLASISPPIYLPQSAAYEGNVRIQHLSVLTTILHRCLLQSDYLRAGRALGLLLRDEFMGRAIDLRIEGRWGIGAEILVRRGCQVANLRGATTTNGHSAAGLCFTRQGFEDAKRYYERLILHHPFRKTAPDAVCALHFYPAMFGLWIYVVQTEASSAAIDESRRKQDSDPEWTSEDETGSDFDGRHGDASRRHLAKIKTRELEQAEQIALSMDDILGSPPYSDSAELLELRGMVSLWIGDLLVSSLPQAEMDDDYDDYESDNAEESRDSMFARQELRLAMEKKESEVRKSGEFFERARERCRGITRTLQNLHIGQFNST